MQFTQTRLARLWDLVLLLHAPPDDCDVESIQTALEVSRATVFRDLELLESAGFHLVRYKEGKQTHYRLLPPKTTPNGLNPKQSYALLLSSLLVSSFRVDEVGAILRQLAGKTR